jgi:light-regulated signal transduction histidine kinase (bacteriophytochrome)
MGTAASMSVSILRKGRLWGLISCHHHTPKRVAYDVRVAADFLAQVLSVQLEAAEYSSEYAERVRLKTIESRLLAHMTTHESFGDGLAEASEDWLNFAEASGAAVISRDDCRLIGKTPTLEQVREICDWLGGQGDGESTHTECLGEVFAPARAYADVASGVLAVRISKLHRSYLLWFRPEVVRTVKWGGEPQKYAGDGDNSPLHPRKSFETWKQTVRGTSLPWRRSQIEAALELRNVVVGIVLRKAEELAELNSELRRANHELEAFSYSVSHDLRAPFRHIVGYAELLREHESDQLTDRGKRYAQTIIDSAQYAGTLVDNLLNFSRISRTSMSPVMVDMNQLVAEIVRELSELPSDRKISWRCADLPPVKGDPMMLRLVWRNLLTNAIKYTRDREEARITIGCKTDEQETVFWVQDNGVGFDMRYVHKLFGVFQRLHRMEEFEGTGIGLANVLRIISRHKGRTWAEGEVGKGATFYFTLPCSSESEVS